MAQNKETVILVLDVSPSMCDAAPGQDSPLQAALDAITLIVQRKIFAESKDEIALVLFGTVETDNPLAAADEDGESYRNVSVAQPLNVASFDFLEYVTKYTHSKTTSADFIDALIVAMDHLQTTLQYKKGFKNKQVILLSNFDNPFEDDQLNDIIAGMKTQGIELNVIGPDLDYEISEDGSGDQCTMTNGIKKEKTKQQRAGEAVVKKMLKETNGNSYSFGEALSMLSHFTSRQTNPSAWKCKLEIGDLIAIPIHGYIKVKAHKLKQSWKKVYTKDPDSAFTTARTFHLNDEQETEIGNDEVVDGYRYGSTLVPMSDKDKKEMKYKSEKCFKILGFTRPENVPSHYYMGDSSMCVVGDPSDPVMSVMLSSLINALYETNTVSIVRRVYNANSAPKVGCLVPHIKTNYECLMYHELPFSEDVRSYTFASLPLDDDGPASKKFKPSAEQLSAIDDLISVMDLTTADEDEDGEPCEFLKPKLTFNPHFQKLYQCLQHKALNPQEPLPELSPLMARQLDVPIKIANGCKSSLDTIKNKFKLELIQKKEIQTGQSFFKDTIESKPTTKNMHEADLKDAESIADIIKSEITQIGTLTPMEDFKKLLNSGKNFVQVSEQMQKQIFKIVTQSIGNQFYKKAMECLKILRKESIVNNKPNEFNNFFVDFKMKLLAKARSDFWEEIVKEKQSLISKVDCEGSSVNVEEAEKFLCKEQAAAKTDTSNDQDSAEDLLDEM